METVLSLSISIITALCTSSWANSSLNQSLQSCPYCVDSPCVSYNSFENKPVQVFKSSNKENSVFCLSRFQIKWEFEWVDMFSVRIKIQATLCAQLSNKNDMTKFLLANYRPHRLAVLVPSGGSRPIRYGIL